MIMKLLRNYHEIGMKINMKLLQFFATTEFGFTFPLGQFDKQFADEFHAADHSRVNLAFRRPFLRADGQVCFSF